MAAVSRQRRVTGRREAPGSGGRAPGLSGPASPKMARAFVPHSGALSPSPSPAARPARTLSPVTRSRRGPAQPGGARAPPTCSGPSPPSALWGPGLARRGSHLANLAFGRLSGAVLGSRSQGESSLCPRLRSTDPGLRRTRHHFPNAFFRPWTPRPREAKRPALGGTARLGHIKMQTPAPGTCPALAQPHICPRWAGGWWGDLVPGSRGWGGRLDGPLHHRPPRLPSLAPSTRLPSCRHIRPGPDINPHQGPCSLFLCCPPLPSPTRVFFFFSSSPLSLPTCHYSRNKKRGDNAGIDGSPLPPPPPAVRASTLSTRPGLEPLPKEPC